MTIKEQALQILEELNKNSFITYGKENEVLLVIQILHLNFCSLSQVKDALEFLKECVENTETAEDWAKQFLGTKIDDGSYKGEIYMVRFNETRTSCYLVCEDEFGIIHNILKRVPTRFHKKKVEIDEK